VSSESGGLPLFQSAKGNRPVVDEKGKAVVSDANQKKKKELVGCNGEEKELKSNVKGKEWMDDAVNGTGRGIMERLPSVTTARGDRQMTGAAAQGEGGGARRKQVWRNR